MFRDVPECSLFLVLSKADLKAATTLCPIGLGSETNWKKSAARIWQWRTRESLWRTWRRSCMVQQLSAEVPVEKHRNTCAAERVSSSHLGRLFDEFNEISIENIKTACMKHYDAWHNVLWRVSWRAGALVVIDKAATVPEGYPYVTHWVHGGVQHGWCRRRWSSTKVNKEKWQYKWQEPKDSIAAV